MRSKGFTLIELLGSNRDHRHPGGDPIPGLRASAREGDDRRVLSE
jgi:hypothetical protein